MVEKAAVLVVVDTALPKQGEAFGRRGKAVLPLSTQAG
jgi:hypothetical protein